MAVGNSDSPRQRLLVRNGPGRFLCSTMWIDALQRKAGEDALVLQKLTSDWQNYSQALSAMKSNISSAAQNMRSLQNSLVVGQQRIVMSNEMYYDLTQQVSGQWLQLCSSPFTLKMQTSAEDGVDFLPCRWEVSLYSCCFKNLSLPLV